VVITEPPWQPTLIYPARGVGALWEPDQNAQPAALRALLGERRASVLRALSVPRSTIELAHNLGVSPGSVSQHLSVLRAAGLVAGHRVGRNVLYVRTPIGDQLAGAAEKERWNTALQERLRQTVWSRGERMNCVDPGDYLLSLSGPGSPVDALADVLS
jgi:DNA-binding transcriptional ArsR family regulator